VEEVSPEAITVALGEAAGRSVRRVAEGVVGEGILSVEL
jgi:hypothetical protein